MITKIAIVGQGFVGSAVREGLRHTFQIFAYDIKQPENIVVYDAHSQTTILIDGNPIKRLLDESDGPIFVCLPTPMNPDGSCNTDIVENVVSQINDLDIFRVLVIKSTIPPGTTERLNKKYTNVRICFNPEFLTERNATEDFKNQDRIVIGGPYEATDAVKQMYQTAFPNVPIIKTSSSVAEMVKYITNCFLATKVSFANEMNQICEKLEIDYDRVVEIATKDSRLGISHWNVPGPDGTGLRGFGLVCFPKDLNALIDIAKKLEIDPKVMQSVWDKNLEVRPERDWEKLIGRAIT
jgi:UDPglucose 6-dehydrogenase